MKFSQIKLKEIQIFVPNSNDPDIFEVKHRTLNNRKKFTSTTIFISKISKYNIFCKTPHLPTASKMSKKSVNYLGKLWPQFVFKVLLKFKNS